MFAARTIDEGPDSYVTETQLHQISLIMFTLRENSGLPCPSLSLLEI